MKTMRKLVLFSLFVLILCFATSCGKEKAKETAQDKPGTVYVLNGFEDSRDLFSLRPSVQQMSASMDIVGKDDGQVKAGKGSMKYTYERGNWPDMVLHIRESEYPKLDIANLNKMNLSVYNDSEKEVSGSIAVVVGRNKTLLTQDFTLEPKQWNELDFRLSALACEYNADQILGFRFRMKAEEGTVFYFDEWSVTMGAKNTEEDDKWEPILLEIIERIDKLPKEITLKAEKDLEELYMDYAELPELYRNIVPNYSSLYASLQQFVDVKFASEEDALERKLLAFDEFYGIGQIDSANYSMMYQTDVKFEDEKGSIKVVFDGATKESYFPYKIPLDPKRYDYVEVSFFNDDVYRKVIYFNWVQRIVIEPQTWGTLKIPGKELMKEGNLIVDTIDEQGTRINSSGTVYMGAMHAYRRDLLAELKKLPNASDVRMKRDIKYLTLIERTMQLYQDTPEVERVNLPKDLVANLEACYAKVSGYSTVFDATQEDIQFGTPDCKAVGEFTAAEDKDYGPVWELNFTAKADGAYAAGFQFTKEFKDNKNMFFYIYNPQSTAQTMELYSDGAWNNLGMHTLEPGWNEIAISTDVPSNYFIFGLFAKTQDVVGTWKVSSLYQVSDTIVNREAAAVVSELIKALPDASKIQMPRDLKYVADIWEAYEAYEALAAGGKSGVSSTLKNKLNACMKAIEGYKASINANTDEMTVGTPDCVCSGNLNRKYDKEYGAVFGLDITKAGTGDYAAGFQVNKDISADKNLFFYMYNPKKAAQTMYLYANPTWDNMGEQVLNPGWNFIELPKDAKIDKYLFGLFPKNADVEGEWLITSVYSKSADVVNAEEASAVKALISKLPNASSIEMPRDLKKVTAIAAAGDAYKALSADAKKKITSAEKAKLDACLKAIEGYTAAINAITDTMTVGTPDAPCQGVMNRKEDATYGPVFALNITKAGTGDYAGGFQVNKDISAYKHLFFYINNPQDTAQTMYLYADPSWKDLGARTLNPGWNLIEIPNEIQIERYIFGIFPKTANAVGEWQITSIYAKSDAVVDKEQSKATSDMINALPDASTIQMPDDIKFAASIYQAKENYDALTSAAKAYITSAQLNKLNACLAAIDGYKVVVNALTDEMSVGTPDCACQGVLNRENDPSAGPVFGLNISAMDTQYYAGGFQVNKDLSTEKNMFFSIYNPFDSNRTMFLYADSNWKDLGARELVPGWNKIELPNDVQITRYVFGLFPLGTDVVGNWKITSFYALSDEKVVVQEAKSVELAIQALKDANELTIGDKSSVDAAKAAYNALSDGAKELVPQESKEKLAACVAKMEELTNSQLTIQEKLAAKLVVDAGQKNFTVWNTSNAGVESKLTVSANSVLTEVMGIPSETAIIILEGSRQSTEFNGAEKISYWIYNPTDEAVNGNFANDTWISSKGFTLAAKAWTRIDIDDTSADQFVSGKKTIYFYVKGGAAVGAEGFLVSSMYADLTAEEITEVETELAKLAADANKSLAEKLAEKTVIDAGNTEFTAYSNKDEAKEAKDHAVFTKVMGFASATSSLVIENSKRDDAFKAATKLTFWVYNPTDTDVNGYYTMDWTKNANFTLIKKAWSKIEVDNTSVDSFITGSATIYFYLNNGAAVGTDEWLVSSMYADLTPDEVTEVETELAKPATTPEKTLAEKLAEKTVIDAGNTEFTAYSNKDEAKEAKDHAVFTKVMGFASATSSLVIENSKRDDAFKAATKLTFWVYNPTDTDVNGYYTMDWIKNANFTLIKKAWSKIEVDNTSVDSFITGSATIYFYLNNGAAVGTDEWLVSSMYADLTPDVVTEVETELAKLATTPEKTLAEKLAEKTVIDAGNTEFTAYSNKDEAKEAKDHAVFTKVMGFASTTSSLVIENSKRSDAFKTATKLTFWVYNPTDTDANGYYTMDWIKNVNFTLTKKAWSKIEVDNTSVDSFLTGSATIYFYLNNGSAVGTDGWLTSSMFADLTPDEVTEIDNALSVSTASLMSREYLTTAAQFALLAIK